MKHAKMLLLAMAVLFFVQVNVAFSQTNETPLVPAMKNVEIVGCIFVKEYQGEKYRVRISEKHLDKYRIAIVTLRIQKDPGQELRIAAADITLHYYYGEYGRREEVAPCDGISVFSKSQDVDRILKTSRSAPGWVKRSTGAVTQSASTVYMDVAFKQIESNISKMWVCIAKPSAPLYKSVGWTK